MNTMEDAPKRKLRVKPPIAWPLAVRRAMRLRLRNQKKYPVGDSPYEFRRRRVVYAAKQYFQSKDAYWQMPV